MSGELTRFGFDVEEGAEGLAREIHEMIERNSALHKKRVSVMYKALHAFEAELQKYFESLPKSTQSLLVSAAWRDPKDVYWPLRARINSFSEKDRREILEGNEWALKVIDLIREEHDEWEFKEEFGI